MTVTEVAELLAGIANGDTLETGSDTLVEAVLAAGLAREVPDQAAERARLTELQGTLRAATTEDARRALRSEILALSETLAMDGAGATIATASGASAYRGGPSGATRRIALTQRGRALLSDHAPRAERAAALSVEQFEAEMSALRATLGRRGRRAASIAASIAKISPQPNAGAWRSAAIGLSACREDESTIAATFRKVLDAIGPRLAPWTPEQGVSAAECLCLVATSLEDIDVSRWVPSLLDQRDRLLSGPSAGKPEYALDAAIVLAATPIAEREGALEAAIALVKTTAHLAAPIALPTALVCVATGNADDALVRHLSDHASALAGPEVDRAMAADALALGMAAGGDPRGVADRILAHRTQLARFSPRASITAGALLAWIDAPLSETLDDLRLAAAVVQTNRLGVDAGETAGNAVKLLLVSALLGTGDEGDDEEALALGARPHAHIARLGLGTIAASVPLLVGATAAFVQPLLDAAQVWDAYQRTSQGYVHHGHYYG